MSRHSMFAIVLGSLVFAGLAISVAGAADPLVKVRPLPGTHAASQLTAPSVGATREAQLAALGKGPKSVRDALAAAQAQSGSFHGGPLLEAAAWKAGIVLTPLAISWTPPVPNPISSAEFDSACVVVNRDHPLPSADQNPPVLHLYRDRDELGQNNALCYANFTPPSGGPYLVTFNLSFEGNTRLIRGTLAPPVVTLYPDPNAPWIASYLTLVGDVSDPTKATCWTGLLNLTDAKRKTLAVVWPHGGNYRWTGLTIRKL